MTSSVLHEMLLVMDVTAFGVLADEVIVTDHIRT
jgi:hypothetical protein